MGRNYKKLIRVFETRPTYALGVRAYVTDSRFVYQWMDHAETIADRDPFEGHRLARTAIRLSLRNGNPCLRVRGVVLYSSTLRSLGRHALSERFYPAAQRLSDGCPSCRSLLSRQLARLRSSQQRYSEALALAELSIELAPDPLSLGRSLACRAHVRFYSERFRDAARDFEAALQHLPAEKKPPALHGYAFSLAYSGDPRLIREAAGKVPEVETALRDVRGQSFFRAKLDWLKGSVAARMAKDEDLTPWQRYRYEREAAHHLGKALRKLVRHRHQARTFAGMPALPLEIAACTADLAAVEAQRDRYKVPEVFKMAVEAWPEEVERLRRAVCDWAEARKPGAAGQMWAALRKLRDMTVEAGCAPPLVPYLDPAEAL